MSTSDQISRLERLGIRLWVENDRLHYDAPAGTISEMQAELIQQKSEILKSLLKAEEKKKSRRPALRSISRSSNAPLSFVQKRLWFLDQFEPNSSVYNIPSAVRLEGLLDVEALEGSLNALVERHETLRTCFGMEGSDPGAGDSAEIEGAVASG